MSLGADLGPPEAPPWLFAPRHKRLFIGRRGLVASTASSLLIIGGLVAVFFLAPGSANVRYYFFNPHNMWLSFVGDPAQGLSSVGVGLLTNIWIFLLS